MTDFNDVTKAKHYNSLGARCSQCDFPIECIDVVQHMPFNVGNTVKYCWRIDEKEDGDRDIEKAIQYLQYELARRRKRRETAKRPSSGEPIPVHVYGDTATIRDRVDSKDEGSDQ